MEVLLAWGTYLALAVLCVAFAWGWLAPRLTRKARLLALGLFAGLAVLAMAVTSQIPHDYSPEDITPYARGGAAIFVQLCTAVVGCAAGLAAAARRRVPAAGLVAAGVYLAGTGLALYLLLGGLATIQSPTLLLTGAVIALSGVCTLVGLWQWLIPLVALPSGIIVAFSVEALRGSGNPGGGPASVPHEMAALADVEGLVLLFAAVLLWRAYGRLLARPLGWAVAALAGTALVLFLRGLGEWTLGPGASSTSLYGVPLTVLAIALSLAILEVRSGAPGKDYPVGDPARGTGWPSTTAPGPLSRALLTALPLCLSLLALGGLAATWHPSPEACAAVAYANTSPLTPQGPQWAVSPAPQAQRGAPNFAEFAGLCEHRTASLSQIVYVVYPTCKWAQVDADYPLVQASGTLQHVDLSHGDAPWIHTSHDLELDVAVDPSSAWLAVDGTPGSLLHVEAESGPFPLAYRPAPGDRVTVAGRWIFDCGHDPATEIHPAAVVADEHDEWRADFPGGLQKVRALRVWMNSAPGVVHVPLAPFDTQVAFPPPPKGQAPASLVKVVTGEQGAVQWTIQQDGRPGAGAIPQAAVHITAPASDAAAYFEMLLGYQGENPAPQAPLTYTIKFDRILVHNDLRQAARNTIGVPVDLINPQLGFGGTGRWIMQVIVDHTWRSLLAGVPVESGHPYSLAQVPSVPVVASGDDHLRFAVTGYAENDPSDGVQLASGRIDGPAVLSWDAGPLTGLCCDAERSFTPTHGAWTLYYRVSKEGP